MGERLTDEYLGIYTEQMERLRKTNPGEWMHEEPWRLALQEIKERRAADLDEHDVMALRWLRQFADGPARRALDKLLGKETDRA